MFTGQVESISFEPELVGSMLQSFDKPGIQSERPAVKMSIQYLQYHKWP
jgi:hypothetical protein